jgi:hypothetical protein
MGAKTIIEAATAAAKRSPVGRNPRRCGLASWAARSTAERERRTRILLDATDSRTGGKAFAKLFASDETFRREFLIRKMIGKARAEAKRNDQRMPVFYQLVPIDEDAPSIFSCPGYSQRRRQRKAALAAEPPQE